MKKLCAAFMITCFALFSAAGQNYVPDAGSLGITANLAGSKACLGAVYHPSRVLAVRPWLGFTLYRMDDEITDSHDFKSWGFEIGSDALFEIERSRNFLLGFGGQVSLAKGSGTTEYADYDEKETGITYKLGALASAQYFFTQIFGIYADVGIGMKRYVYRYEEDEFNTDAKYTETSFGLSTSSLGVVFYVK